MNADLQRLIRLQQLDSAADQARRRLAEEPERQTAFDARIDAARQAVASAKEQLAANQTARRDIEKEVAVHQARLSKFREQAMAVKTNQEFHAIQHEIGYAQNEVKVLEDRVLERMLEADELAAGLKNAERALAAAEKDIAADRRTLAAELGELKTSLDRIAEERRALVAEVDPKVLSTFETVAKRRNGIAIAEARDGICTICHVRLRPQVFNTILRNEEILQCDHCQRILFFAAPTPARVSEPAP